MDVIFENAANGRSVLFANNVFVGLFVFIIIMWVTFMLISSYIAWKNQKLDYMTLKVNFIRALLLMLISTVMLIKT